MRRALPATVVGVALLVLAGCGGSSSGDLRSGNPFAVRAQYDAPSPRLEAAAAQSAADGDEDASRALTSIATTPSGIWLTPERYGLGEVGPYVAGLMADSAEQTVPLFVIYGIPDRDCSGQESSGGLDASDYLPWVQEIADAIGSQGVVVLEPDALPGVLQCSIGDTRLRLLSEAVDALVADEVVTYLDAGHSDWISPDQMAPLLTEIGIAKVRGFATNVSNYQPQSAEMAFASDLSGLLDGTHYVIDTGRNGDPAGTQEAVSDWCNPSGRALGARPGFVEGEGALDALLWIKPPAESDGTCHGGPVAGDIWVQRAIELSETTTS